MGEGRKVSGADFWRLTATTLLGATPGLARPHAETQSGLGHRKARADAATHEAARPADSWESDPVASPWPASLHHVSSAASLDAAPVAVDPERTGAARHEVMAQAAACDAALGHDKVALLFLSRGPLPQERAWGAFFAGGAGVVPRALQALPAGRREAIGRACPASLQRLVPLDPIAAQRLFSVYVHVPPSQPDFGIDSTFFGRLIDERVDTAWGAASIIDATRALMRAGLTELANQKFVMVSESGVPLYPASLVWLQLTGETKSRIDACTDHAVDPWRWHPDMAADFSQQQFRKSSQWVALRRDHTWLVVNDTRLDEAFRRSCQVRDPDPVLGHYFECFADEHYLPTLLAVHGAANATDCRGYLMHVRWDVKNSAHPHAYQAAEVSPELWHTLRLEDSCQGTAAVNKASHYLMPLAALGHAGHGAKAMRAWPTALLGAHCPLLARKFPEATADAVLELFSRCDPDLGLGGCTA